MKINRQNYEEYLLDYLEGKLSQEVTGEVHAFLEQNPDIKDETEELLDCKLDKENYSFNNKDIIKKNPDYDIEGISKFEQLSVARLEGDISLNETEQLNTLIDSSKRKQYEHDIIQKCLVVVDKTIVFPNKSKLKHLQLTPARTRFYYFAASIAAAIVLLIGFMFLFSNSKELKGLALNNSNTTIQPTRQVSYSEKDNSIYVDNEVPIVITENETKDTVVEVRISAAVVSINSKSIQQINQPDENIQVNTQLLESLAISYAQNNTEFKEEDLEEYINKKLEELEIKQPKEKFSVASLGKSFLEWITATFKKKVQIKQENFEDGRKLYAVRAGSLEFYTNVRGKKNKDKSEENIVPKGE